MFFVSRLVMSRRAAPMSTSRFLKRLKLTAAITCLNFVMLSALLSFRVASRMCCGMPHCCRDSVHRSLAVMPAGR